MRIVLLGCPGAGKGTQARRLAEKYGLLHIATGDLLRAQIEVKSDIGARVADYLRKGMLVPDDIVLEMVVAKLDSSKENWLLDGFPRNLEQAQALDKYLKDKKLTIDLVLYLAMKEAAVISRLSSRRGCASCGEVFNVLSRPPRTEGQCDKCQGKLVHREDDSEATIHKRLMVYEDLTRPLVSYYRHEYEFLEVDGDLSVEEVTSALCDAIGTLSAAH